MPKMKVQKTVELPSQYEPFVFDSMHGGDGPVMHLDFTEEDGTKVNVRIPLSKDLIAQLKDKLKGFSTDN